MASIAPRLTAERRTVLVGPDAIDIGLGIGDVVVVGRILDTCPMHRNGLFELVETGRDAAWFRYTRKDVGALDNLCIVVIFALSTTVLERSRVALIHIVGLDFHVNTAEVAHILRHVNALLYRCHRTIDGVTRRKLRLAVVGKDIGGFHDIPCLMQLCALDKIIAAVVLRQGRGGKRIGLRAGALDVVAVGVECLTAHGAATVYGAERTSMRLFVVAIIFKLDGPHPSGHLGTPVDVHVYCRQQEFSRCLPDHVLLHVSAQHDRIAVGVVQNHDGTIHLAVGLHLV